METEGGERDTGRGERQESTTVTVVARLQLARKVVKPPFLPLPEASFTQFSSQKIKR